MTPIETMTLSGRIAFVDQTVDGEKFHTMLVGGLLKSTQDFSRNNGNWEMVEARVTIEVFRRYRHHRDCPQGCRLDTVLHDHLGSLECWEPVTVLDFLPDNPVRK